MYNQILFVQTLITGILAI